MTTTAARSWSAAQARYDTLATAQGTSPAGGLPVQYVPTRHGLVARCWGHYTYVEVALLRRRNTGATFQGSIELVRGGWRVTDATGAVLATFTGDYLDAEAQLLRRRTGVRSQVDYGWPAGLVRELRNPPLGAAGSGYTSARVAK